MRLSSTLVLLPALAAAQNQFPFAEQLQGLIEKAKSFLPTAPAVATPPEQSAAPPVVPKRKKDVASVKLSNWQSLLAPVPADASQEAREWLVYVTGGNKTCFGRCGPADKAWNESIPLFATDLTSPSLGVLDCEKEAILCSIWSAGAPSLWYFQIPVAPEAEQPKPATSIHTLHVNVTTVTAEDIYKVHSEKRWEKVPAYEGAFHPMDGWLAQYGLNVVIGYIVFGIGQVPSWLMMVGVSFISRSMMSRRLGPQQQQQQRRAAAAPQAAGTQ
ncbi:hypothetical protein D8B26_007487 [Coccidioides posadasii str. Silveira]|uniref:Uncharacterized protein n=3 Tax=Coccidioides posadasii TaxID=199306 RepID=E9D217_COCPS|nr:hypothetical protein CPC735_015120 [Coccidioides posadasii C735 delta SOWgp]EER24914.1 hypothetical protein CPC735_015120 [Coccidioides posadasii C735 delta SOWgp]EFW19231.1 conserved hypothetical protein [Coccidioides posadasii str. Silveira]KMM71695.1 hypothetical protein CPAG_07998 [Coccidioides posadasii RMSCC 3488]QVM12870.1 hypothetical protein D8B26_007487 [Coccidioides posadasii str. Silveira]|eukprot:XP_003067059.1 hypothetical protein CPC735_015120 [Coccidioides posadasii C735 delta SOWgp]